MIKTFVLIRSRFCFILISLSFNFTNACLNHDELRNGVHTDARTSNNPHYVNVLISDVFTNHLSCEIPPNTKEFVDLYSASASMSCEMAKTYIFMTTKDTLHHEKENLTFQSFPEF